MHDNFLARIVIAPTKKSELKRFMQSTDMTNWTLTPSECVFQKDRYAGSPALYAFEDDPYYYVGYLEAYPHRGYANCIARSTDLVSWEYSPINPVLMYNDFEDKQIASAFLTPADRQRIEDEMARLYPVKKLIWK